MILIIIAWIILSFMVANMGSSKKIGGTGAFLISIIFSPLIGLLFVIASSPDKIDKKVTSLTSQAVRKYNRKEYNESLKILNEALTIDPTEKQTHFNLASIYSLIKDKEKAFLHLQKAVELGYKNLGKISSSEDFKWLKEQLEFESFMKNGYKSETKNIEKNNHLDDLKKIAELKENGILTEMEFQEQKQKILNSN